MPAKKVLIISYSFLPNVSGVADVVHEYGKQMLETHFAESVTVVAHRGNDLLASETIDGVAVRRFRAPALLGGRIPFPGKEFFDLLNTIISTDKPDQIHVHTRFSMTTLFGVLVAKRYRIPVIEFEHLSSFVSGESWFVNTASWLWDQTISRLTFALADRVVCVSQSTRKFVCMQLGSDLRKTFVVENGCNIAPLRESFDDRFENTIDKPVIFFAARFVPLKNPLLTLETMRLLDRRGVDFTVLMAGSGKLDSEIKDFVYKNQLDSKIKLLGRLSHYQIQEYLQCSHIFMNISQLEGLPGGVMEAVLSNNLCLVSNVGGNNDVVTVPELLVDKQNMNFQDMADRLEYIINHLKEISHNAQQDKDRLTQNTWTNSMKKLAQVLNVL